jgi:hypothetical protein
MGPIVGALGVKLVMAVDPEQLERVQGRHVQRKNALPRARAQGETVASQKLADEKAAAPAPAVRQFDVDARHPVPHRWRPSARGRKPAKRPAEGAAA